MKKILKYVILSLILVCLICGAVYKFVPFNIAKRMGVYDKEAAYIVPYSDESVKISGQGCDEVAALLNGLKGTPFSRKGITGAAPEQFVDISTGPDDRDYRVLFPQFIQVSFQTVVYAGNDFPFQQTYGSDVVRT